MVRPFVASLLLLAGAVVADGPDPEPPKPLAGSTAKSGDFVVSVDRTGIVNASNKFGQLLWKCQLARRGGAADGQVVIEGAHVVVALSGMTSALDLRSGKMFWRRINGLAGGALAVKNGKVILTHRGKKEVLDLRTGKLLEASR